LRHLCKRPFDCLAMNLFAGDDCGVTPGSVQTTDGWKIESRLRYTLGG
jgi:hypothetical protein